MAFSQTLTGTVKLFNSTTPINLVKVTLSNSSGTVNCFTNTSGVFGGPGSCNLGTLSSGSANVTTGKTTSSNSSTLIKDGISGGDINLGQRFLAGTLSLNPYQMIALNVNNNTTPNVIDLVDLNTINAIILNNPTTLNTAPNWRFASKYTLSLPLFQTFFNTSVTNTSNSTFFNQIQLSPFNTGYVSSLPLSSGNLDFTAIKSGDANTTATGAFVVNNNDNNIVVENPSMRNASDLLNIQSNNLINAGDEFEISFSPNISGNLAAYQFGLNFNTNEIEYLSLQESGDLYKMNVNNLGLNELGIGKIKSCWFNRNIKNSEISEKTKLFVLKFRAKKNIEKMTEFFRIDDQFAFETYDMNGNFVFNELTAQITKTKSMSSKSFPNPFREKTTFEFVSNTETQGVLTITDNLGRVVNQNEIDIRDGLNQVQYDGSELLNGVYFYSVKSANTDIKGSVIKY